MPRFGKGEGQRRGNQQALVQESRISNIHAAIEPTPPRQHQVMEQCKGQTVPGLDVT